MLGHGGVHVVRRRIRQSTAKVTLQKIGKFGCVLKTPATREAGEFRKRTRVTHERSEAVLRASRGANPRSSGL